MSSDGIHSNPEVIDFGTVMCNYNWDTMLNSEVPLSVLNAESQPVQITKVLQTNIGATVKVNLTGTIIPPRTVCPSKYSIEFQGICNWICNFFYKIRRAIFWKGTMFGEWFG